MRIAFLCKRRYMSKDVILDRYARLYEIPYQLAALGHEVRGYCLDYHAKSDGAWEHAVSTGTLSWESCSLGKLHIPKLFGYPAHLLRRLREYAPEVLIGASDIPHVTLAAWLARRLGIPHAVDLYDNFEGFGQARIPGFVTALRKATRSAGLITTTSEPLRRHIFEAYGATGKVIAVPSSVDKAVFRPREKHACRTALGLPDHAKLVGTAGGLSRDKGIFTLYEAWNTLRVRVPNAHLVLAGPLQADLPLPKGPRVHYLGMLAHEHVAELFGALDVGVMCIRDTTFGRYCFPQKAYEMLASALPVISADVGAMSELLKDWPQLLFEPENGEALASAVIRQLEQPVVVNIPIRDWTELVREFEPFIRQLVKKSNG